MGTALLFINLNLLVLPLAIFTNGNLTGFAGNFAAAIGRARALALSGAAAAGVLERRRRLAFADLGFAFLRLSADDAKQCAQRQHECESNELLFHKSPRGLVGLPDSEGALRPDFSLSSVLFRLASFCAAFYFAIYSSG